jgi:hypothetical protein
MVSKAVIAFLVFYEAYMNILFVVTMVILVCFKWLHMPPPQHEKIMLTIEPTMIIII